MGMTSWISILKFIKVFNREIENFIKLFNSGNFV